MIKGLTWPEDKFDHDMSRRLRTASVQLRSLSIALIMTGHALPCRFRTASTRNAFMAPTIELPGRPPRPGPSPYGEALRDTPTTSLSNVPRPRHSLDPLRP